MLDAAFGWIGEFVHWLAAFVPRWTLVRATERGVKFLPGGKTKEVGPGIQWYWPASTELETMPVVRQVLDTQPQTLMTKDNKPVYVSGVVIYSISDLHTFLVDNYDAQDNLDDLVQMAIRKAIVNRTFDQIQQARADVDNILTKEASKALEPFGVSVEAARLTDFSLARVANIVGNGLMNMHINSTGGNIE